MTEIPGPRSAEMRGDLARFESRNVTYLGEDFPVFWESASGATVVDVDGNRYLDLTAAFGVANAGHANPRVVEAIHTQAERLMHGMGDVHPTHVRARLLERLANALPTGLNKIFLATTGSEAVEAAMKTAMLATGKAAFASYRGAYHGLSFGALTIGGIERFRAPFAGVLSTTTLMLDFPAGDSDGDGVARELAALRRALVARGDLAAVVIEPIQSRGGIVVPPGGYLRGLRAICDELGIVLIFDEIYTGFGRTGSWFACMHDGIVPDIICIGKAMGSGFPISAIAARADVMDAWPVSRGEALHTSTYLGNPMGCAAALATIDELERLRLPERARELAPAVEERLQAFLGKHGVRDVRGRGLMWGVELRDAAQADAAVKAALRLGLIVLQTGRNGNVISVTPPLVIGRDDLDRALDLLENAIAETGGPP